MRYRKELTAPMHGVEAASRAQYVLGKWNYRVQPVPKGLLFERGFPLSALFVVHPFQVHSRILMTIRELENGCQVVLDQHIYKLGQPCCILDKIVWQGDLDDVEASLTRRQEPTIDRSQQNAHAGKISLIYVTLTILFSCAIGLAVGVSTGSALIGGGLALALIIFIAALMPLMPFRMPDFPLENAIPFPGIAFSNYLRSGRNAP